MTPKQMLGILQSIDVPGPPKCRCPLWQPPNCLCDRGENCICDRWGLDKCRCINTCDCPRLALPPCPHVIEAGKRFQAQMTALFDDDWLEDPSDYWHGLLDLHMHAGH